MTSPSAPAAPAGSGPAPQSAVQTPGGVITRRESAAPFQVHLDVFSGPFELLLGLIAKHKLDLSEIALADVTDEFIAHIRGHQADDTEWDLSEASEFLLVAATLLDLKAARLLPARVGGDEEDVDLIEARDLLFARLLQFRAFKEVAAWCQERMLCEGRIHARRPALEPRFTALLPQLVLGIGPERLAMIAAAAMRPRPEPAVATTHLHEAAVNLREQTWIVSARLRVRRTASFRALVSDAESTQVIVARFLVLLDLFQAGAVAFEQVEPLGDLVIRWTGQDRGPGDHRADPDAVSGGQEQPHVR
ncbi:MAG TPA: ScpA family protein [Dermatophilaceae bacterium]|nr:ScpA family protein [Dermatophilaceae bacterium]